MAIVFMAIVMLMAIVVESAVCGKAPAEPWFLRHSTPAGAYQAVQIVSFNAATSTSVPRTP
jgi:hypothetical protein